MSRSVPIWTGKTDDSAIPARVRLRVFEAFGGRCALSGRKIMPGDEWQLDHRIPLAMGGEHSEANLQPVLATAHRLKTKADVADIAKARRVKLKHVGAWPKPKRRLQGRGFEKGRNTSFSTTKSEKREAK